MDPPERFGASPGTPLFALSPERVNGIRPPYSNTTPLSPSMPEFGKPSLALKPSLLSGSPEAQFRHSRNNSASDAHVQGLVARFDGLSVKDYKAQSEVAIRRADMAREMAEMERDKSRREAKALDEEVRRMREEMRKAKKDIEEGKERERKVSKRLEVVMVWPLAIYGSTCRATYSYVNRKNITVPKRHTITLSACTRRRSARDEKKRSSPARH
jgi:hypothetical protein